MREGGKKEGRKVKEGEGRKGGRKEERKVKKGGGGR